jgi:WD40 repeat protein
LLTPKHSCFENYATRERAELALTQFRLQTAEARFKEDDPQAAVAYLADFVKQSPTNNPAAERLMSALTFRNFVLPVSDVPSVKSRENTESKHIKEIQFSPDGMRIVTIANDGTVQLWDTLTARPLPEPLQLSFPSKVPFVEFSPDGQTIITVSQGEDTEPAPLPAKHEEGRLPPPRNLRIAETAWGDKPIFHPVVELWDAKTGQSRGKPVKLSGNRAKVRIASDGRRIVTLSVEGESQLWDSTDGQLRILAWESPAWVRFAEFNANNQRILTVTSAGVANVWDAGTGREVGKPVDFKGTLGSVVFSPDGQRILAVYLSGHLRIGHSQTGRIIGLQIAEFGTSGIFTRAEFSSDGRKILTVAKDGRARLWDAESGLPLSEPINAGRPCQRAFFCQDGTQILTVFDDNSAILWDAWPGGVLPEDCGQ